MCFHPLADNNLLRAVWKHKLSFTLIHLVTDAMIERPGNAPVILLIDGIAFFDVRELRANTDAPGASLFRFHRLIEVQFYMSGPGPPQPTHRRSSRPCQCFHIFTMSGKMYRVLFI